MVEAQAEQRPVVLFDGKMPAEIEDGDLAHLAANALAAHQAKGEIALAGDFVVGSGLTDEHALMLPENQGKNRSVNTIMAQQNDFPIDALWVYALIQSVARVAGRDKSNNMSIIDYRLLKMG